MSEFCDKIAMDVYLFFGFHNSYFPPDDNFQVLVQVASSSPSLIGPKVAWVNDNGLTR